MKLRPAAAAVGITGNLALAWGTYNITGCTDQCPEATPWLIAILLGVFMGIASAFMGAFVFGLFGTFTAIGLASVLRGLNMDGDTTFAFVFGGFFLAPTVLLVLAIPLVRRREAERQALLDNGRRSVATVTAVEDTGVTINDNPRVRLTLSFDGFEHDKAMTVSRVAIPRAGDRYPITYDPHDPSSFELGGELPREAEPAAPLAAGAEPADGGWVNELGRLNDLRLQGALTDEEFARAKEKLLG